MQILNLKQTATQVSLITMFIFHSTLHVTTILDWRPWAAQLPLGMSSHEILAET